MDENEIIRIIGRSSYMKALNISSLNVSLYDKNEHGNVKRYAFVVDSQSYYDENYNVAIVVSNGKIINYACNCPEFYRSRTCKHIGAVLIHHKKLFIPKELDIKELSKEIINDIIPMRKMKTLINLEIELDFAAGKYDEVTIKLKIGEVKLYSLNNKFGSFVSNFEDDEMFFGKNFTYNPNEHYFNKTDDVIIRFLIKNYDKKKNQYYYENSITLGHEELEDLLKIMKDKIYNITTIGNTKGYIIGNPFKTSITFDELYKFKVQFDATILTTDFKYVYKEQLYCIPDLLANLYKTMNENNINELVLDEADITKLSKKTFAIIVDKLEIEESIKEKFTVIKPNVKLYLDFNDKVLVRIVFGYNGKEINYFDKQEPFRNEEIENDVITELKKYRFIFDKKNIYLDEVNDIVKFIEEGVFELSEKYEIFSTEKMKNANIVKKTSISSQFSIGKDNIMSYQFDLGEIDASELNKIFDNMKNNKQYYKLKSGKILDTNDENLKELQDLMDNLDINSKNMSGIIPKYHAIYLDSIKNYSIIKTNNLFKQFINNFNQYKNVDMNISIKDEKILREYQKIGVKWLYNIYKCGFGGILADEMGLGKSIQTIMFLKQVIKENKDAKILIIAPTSLIYNWEHEFDLFGKELKYQVIAENKNKRLELLKDFDRVNIFITTYGLTRQDYEEYINKEFEIVIIDEAQNIKNPKAGISKVVKELNAKIKIALTGTPVENSVLEIWSIFDFIMPGYLNNLNKFQSKYNIKDIDEQGRQVLNNLSLIIKPFILRRKKKEVLFDLPDKLENNIYLDLLPEQKKIYAAQVKKTQQEFEELMKTEGFLKARFKILQLLTRLRQICIDPSIVFENYKGSSVKIEEVVDLIIKSIENGHKILLFTSFKTALEIVKNKLKEHGIKNYVIDGSVSSKDRNMLVTNFNKDDTNVFLITLKAGGTGLNLTSADIVIHLDLWWNPQVENQATDRAHRIGQKNTVEVVKLICKGTIEEKIIELQNKKKILNDTLIDDGSKNENVISKLDAKDIKELLSYSE